MPLSGALNERLSEQLSRHLGTAVDVEREKPMGGGSINDCYRLETDQGPFFVKVNSADRSPSLFEAEADGLQRIAATDAVRVPQVIAWGEDHDDSFLLLEHITTGLKSASFWEAFGRSLAGVHRNSHTHFGFDRDNYIGSLPQHNARYERWVEFFVHARIEPQLRMARDGECIGAGDVLRFERLFGKLAGIFPEEPPALLHGDLWSGNFLCDERGGPVLIDPAVYYGHREMDVAMSRLFGGFDPAFYSAYAEAWPLAPGWEERSELCNLYPLLVHVNLFGGGYGDQVHAVLRRFT